MVWYDPRSAEVHADPYPIYDRLRISDPAQYNPFAQMWFLSRHGDCSAVLRDARFSARLGQDHRAGSDELPRSMLALDPPEHTRLREPVNRALNGGRVERMRDDVRGAVAAVVSGLARDGEGDAIAAIARPVSAAVVARVIGIGGADVEPFHDLTRGAGEILDPLAPPAAVQRAADAATALESRLAAALERASRSPGDDLLGALAHAASRGIVSDDEAVAACLLVAIGGYEPLVHAIGNALLALLEHPVELARFRDTPRLRVAAVSELLRFDSPIQFAARVPLSAVRFDGAELAAGRPVVTLLGAANRDPAVFLQPGELRLDRRPNPHLAFGAGVHTCPGAGLARMAIALTLEGLVDRFVSLALAIPSPPRRASGVPRGVETLPLRLSAS